jgi:hypothetical protein
VKQVGRSPSTGLPATSCDNLDSYTPNESGGLQGTDRAVTTYCLPPQPLWGYRSYTLMATHGPCQTRWPNSPKRAAQISELLGGPCRASRDYLLIKKTKSVRIDIVSSADTTVVIGWD